MGVRMPTTPHSNNATIATTQLQNIQSYYYYYYFYYYFPTETTNISKDHPYFYFPYSIMIVIAFCWGCEVNDLA
jgi:hypothetical protein